MTYCELGASEYTGIKTSELHCVGLLGEPVAEKTKLGWTIMSPGTEIDHTNMLWTQTCHVDYAEFCRLDVLGKRILHISQAGDLYCRIGTSTIGNYLD
ncbi:unnamed protein product [Porites lobata]|uniref:Uncharacterized protein n=1 Tax=Porites lobata TaxID=104759 RepID=A0ABN8MRK8_9CNID|nr:unnamed protein product [Porites lobata]